MKSILRKTLALAVLTALSACGGGGSTSVAPTTNAAQPAGGSNATASVTLKFPAHFAHAKAGKTTSATKRRAPAYINPTSTYSLVVKLQNIAVQDPSTGHPYFSVGAANPDGSSNITVPISSGSYNDGALIIQEYDDSTGSTGDLLAQGSNQPYSDPNNGNNIDGGFTVAPGGTLSIPVTMNMNNQYIILTTDPIAGSDAIAITSNYQCFPVTPGTPVYAFSGDSQYGFVLPGTPSGYSGGDGNNSAYPGIPPVSLQSQSTANTGGTTSKLAALPFGWNFIFDGSNGVDTTFYAPNALFGYGNYANADIDTPGDCG
jgi:predicted small lipoprotein YifL